MDIPLPDDPPPPLNRLTPPIDIQLPPTENKLPLGIDLPSVKTESAQLNIDIPSDKTKPVELSKNIEPSVNISDAGIVGQIVPSSVSLVETKTLSELNPLNNVSASKTPMDYVYSPSVSEPPSPINPASVDNDRSSSQPAMEIDLPPSVLNPLESDSQSSKFTPLEIDHQASHSGIGLPASEPFAPNMEGNSSSKFPWDIEIPPSKAVPLPPDTDFSQQRNLSPWEIDLPSDSLKHVQNTLVVESQSFSEVKASLIKVNPSEMDIPMPDDLNDPNRYSPSLPVDDEPPLEITPPQPKGSRQSLTLTAPPLPPLLPSSLGGSSTVLGRTKAKKRLMAFSMTKQGGGTGLSFALSKKQPPVSKDVVKAFDDKGDEGKKKALKKGQSVDKARDTISEIEELKRKEMMLRENMQMLHPRWGSRDSHLYPLTGMLPIPEIVDAKKTEEIESLVGELLAKKDKKKDDRRSGSDERNRDRDRHRSSKSKRSDRDRERERRKRKPKTLPLDWKEFKRDGHKVHHFRRFKFEILKLESKEKRRHRRGSRDRDRRSRSKDRDKKDSKSTSTQPNSGRINLLETPMEIRKVLVALTARGDDLEFPEFLVKYTKVKPQLSYCENPRFATYHFMNRREMLATVPHDIEEIIFKFLTSIQPKRLKVKSETKELEDKADEEVKGDLDENDIKVDSSMESKAEGESEESEEHRKTESNSESLVCDGSTETNERDKIIETENKTEVKSSCRKLHRNWFVPWKTCQLIPQYLLPNEDNEVEVEEILQPSRIVVDVNTLGEVTDGRGEISESVYPSRKRNISKSSDNAVITEELEPIIRTAIRSKWDSDYEDSQDGIVAEKKVDKPVEKDASPVTNGMDVGMEEVADEVDNDNLGVVPMDIVEDRNDGVEDLDNSFVAESEKSEPTNVVEKLASEYEEFMKMVSFEDNKDVAEDKDEVQDEYESSKFSNKMNESVESNIDKHQSFADYLAEIETVESTKPSTRLEEDEGTLIDKELWETKRLYFNRSRSASPDESDMSGKGKLTEKEASKKKNKKKKIQASKIKKKLKDKKLKKKKKKYSSSESSSSSSSSDESSDESSSSDSSSSSSASSSETSSSSSSDSSVDRKKLRKKKKTDKLRDKGKNKKNKKNQTSSSSEDDDVDDDNDDDKRKKDKKRKKKKVEKKKKIKVDKNKKLKDKKNKKKRSRESSEDEEFDNKKTKKNKKVKKKEEFLSLENSLKKKGIKKKCEKIDEKKHKEKIEKEIEYPSTKSLKRASLVKEDSDVPKKKVRPEKESSFENVSDAEISRFFDLQSSEKQKSQSTKFETDIDEDFKKSKEYRRMKRRELEFEDTDSLTKEFEPKSLALSKKPSKSFGEDMFEDFEDGQSKSKQYFFHVENSEKKVMKEKSKQDFELFDPGEESSRKQRAEDIQKVSKLKDMFEQEVHDKEERDKFKLDKDSVTKVNRFEKKAEDEDDQNSKMSSKNKKKAKKEKKKKESDGGKPRKKKRNKKAKSSPKDEVESVENHIHFLRDENFLFELGKHKTDGGGTKELDDEKSSDYDGSGYKSGNSSKLKNDDCHKSNEENSNGSVHPRNLEWHDDSETRGSLIRRLQTLTGNKSNNNTCNSSLGLQYGSEDDGKSSSSESAEISASNSLNILSEKDADLKLYSDDSKKKLVSSPLGHFPSFSIGSLVESDDDSVNKEKADNRSPSPDSSLGDIEIESQDNSFVLEKDVPVTNDIDVSEAAVKKGVFSEVSIKEMEGSKSIPDNFKVQEETYKTGTNDSDRYSPTLDLDLMSPPSLTGEDKCGSDMSLDSNEPEDSFSEIKKSDILNMLDIPLPPPVGLPSQLPLPIPCPVPVPPPLLRPNLVATSPSFKNILNIPSVPPPLPQVETKTLEPLINLIRKEPIRLPLTNTRLTLNKPLVKVRPANIFDDDDDEESNSLSKNLIDSPEKEIQHSSVESDSDQSKKKRSRWGMEPEDDLPIVKLYLANEVAKQTPSVEDADCNESQTSKEISDDTSLFDKEKSTALEKKFDDANNKVEDQSMNEKRDIQSIDVSTIDVENAQEAWKDQENFNAVGDEQNSESIEVSRHADLNKQSIQDKIPPSDADILDSVNTVQTKNLSKIEETKVEYLLDARVISNEEKLAEVRTTEEVRTDSRHEKGKSKSDDSYRRRDYSGDRSRSSRRRDSSRDRRRKRDSSRDRRDYSRKDRSRSKEHRRDRSRDRYRRDSPDRKGKKRDRSRDRRRRDSSRDRKRDKSPRRREDISRDSPRRRGDIRESPRRKEDVRESPRKRDDSKESLKIENGRESPRREDSKERKTQVAQEVHAETESETSENDEVEGNIEDIVLHIKEEPFDDGYEIMKENIVENIKEQQVILTTKVESVEPKPLETTQMNLEELPPPRTQKIKINFKNPQVLRKTSPLGFKRSLADSTSDSELIPVKKLIRTSVCLSPKRLSLDDRIELELGVKKSPPPPPAPAVQTYYQIPVHDGSQITAQVLPVPQQRRAPTTLVQPPRVDWDAEVFAPTGCLPPVLPTKTQVLQVGNILQVVPTEMVVSTPPSAPVPVAAPVIQQENLQHITNKVLQIGNMIQVVPTTTVPALTPAQIFANAIANAVASVASSSSSPAKVDPSPVVKPTLPVASVQPTMSVAPPSPEEEVLSTHTSPLLLPLPVAKKAVIVAPVPEGDTRRLEKERRKREKEMRRQQKQKKATKKMIREALLMKEALESSDMENDDVRLSDEEGTDEEEPIPAPEVLTTPVSNKLFSPLPPPPGKGILVSPGFREKPVLVTKPVETRKVSFADGVHPGEGTSPSASEEHPHSPPPQPSNPKDKRYKKKKKKRKVKVRIIRVEEGDDDDEDEDGSPPPPPPGSPPPMFHYPPPPPGFMYAPPPSFTVLQGGGDGQTFAPVYQQHHSSTTTTHTTTVQFAPPPPPPLSKHPRK